MDGRPTQNEIYFCFTPGLHVNGEMGAFALRWLTFRLTPIIFIGMAFESRQNAPFAAGGLTAFSRAVF